MAKKTALNKLVKQKVAKERKPMGRPTLYSVKVADRICELLSVSDRGLHHICRDNADIPSFTTIMRWLGEEDKKYFRDIYAYAREAQGDFLVEKMLDIADDGSNDFMTIRKGNIEYEVENKEWTSRSKLRVDTYKFLITKVHPKKYGDKLDVTSDNKALQATQTTIQIEIVKPEE